MATHTIGKFLGIGRLLARHKPTLPRCYSLYTPDYLESGKSKIPLYATLNIQIKGYGYPVLENYQSFVDVLAETLDLEVDDRYQFDQFNVELAVQSGQTWALPPTCYKIQKFKPNSAVTVSEYEIKEYERNIQLTDVSATKYPILLRALEASLPEGVTLKVEYFNSLYENKRYVPDKQLLELKEELDSMKRK